MRRRASGRRSVRAAIASGVAVAAAEAAAATASAAENPNWVGLTLRGQTRRPGLYRDQDNARVQKYVLSELDSGERVISERVPGVRSVAIGFWIGAGSRDETDAKAGVSHFLEHLLFKGTASYTAQEIAEIFDALGGELNAEIGRASCRERV